MGTFAEAVKANRQEQQCIIARAIEGFDANDRAAFDDLLERRKYTALVRALGAIGPAPSQQSLVKHASGRCMCNRETN